MGEQAKPAKVTTNMYDNAPRFTQLPIISSLLACGISMGVAPAHVFSDIFAAIPESCIYGVAGAGMDQAAFRRRLFKM